MFTAIKQFFTGEHDAAFFVTLAVYGIIILYLFTLGIPDLLRFSIKRIWAISGVCFSESIRRRVLWIIPLALVGLVFVIWFQQSWDPQEDIRQATKFCLFTTGLVVVISTVILACTSLPREIESRVIFTVVTKPTTRLEIILGKITGFARMSATILIIMGVFTFGYLHLRAWSLQRDLKERLAGNAVEAISKPTFDHYVQAGLLNAKEMAGAQSMNIYQFTPADPKRRYPTADGGMVLIPFKFPDDLATAGPDGTEATGLGMMVNIRVGYDRTEPKASAPGKPVPAWTPPKVTFSIFDQNQQTVLSSEIKGLPVVIPAADGTVPVSINVTEPNVINLAKLPYFFVAVAFNGGDGNMWIDDDPANPPVTLTIPTTDKPQPVTLKPFSDTMVFIGREGVSGQQVKGDATGKTQVCVFHFSHLTVSPTEDKQVPIEFRLGVEKSGEVGDEDVPTQATVTVYNLGTKQESAPIAVTPENNRWFYTSVPAEAIAGGDFEIRVRCLSEGQWLNLRRSSLLVVQSDNSFGWNLFKSSLIIWMLSVLVTSIAVFCSTFLSWPIAVVATLMILFAHWGVDQLGDSATAGIGRSVVQEFGMSNPATMHVVSDSVEALNKVLKQVAAVLPDTDKFSATEEIDHGISIPAKTLEDSLLVLAAFGIPFSVLAYIVLKNKEVAP
jgi:hypothetical protein